MQLFIDYKACWSKEQQWENDCVFTALFSTSVGTWSLNILPIGHQHLTALTEIKCNLEEL